MSAATVPTAHDPTVRVASSSRPRAGVAALLRRFPAIPSRCAVCRDYPADPVCEPCVTRFAQPIARCGRCALPLAAGIASTRPQDAVDRDGSTGFTCAACRLAPPPFSNCHAAVSYQFPWADLLGRFKFGGEPGWAASFALLMRSAPGIEDAVDAADLVVPVPLAPARLAERGYNQAWELARRLGPHVRADAGALVRVRETLPQPGLGRDARIRNLEGAFAAHPSRRTAVDGCRVLLVDDVMTSGASLRDAARALLHAGASRVDVAVFARTDEPDAADSDVDRDSVDRASDR